MKIKIVIHFVINLIHKVLQHNTLFPSWDAKRVFFIKN